MPHITNDKQTSIQKDLIKNTLAKIRYVKNIPDMNERYKELSNLAQSISNIDPNLLDQPQEFIQNYLYQIVIMVATTREESKAKMVQALIFSIFKKIVDVFANRTKDTDTLDYILRIFNRPNLDIFNKPQTRIFISFSSSEQQKERNKFYHDCVTVIIKELSLYPKIVWQIQMKEIISLIKFINSIQPNPLHTKEASELIKSIHSEINAFFNSGRPQLSKFSKSKDISNLIDALSKKKDKSSHKKDAQLGLSLAQRLLRANTLQQNKAGLALLQAFTRSDFHNDRISLLRESQIKDWLNNNQIYQYIFSQPHLYDQVIEKYIQFIKFIKKCKENQEKTSLLLQLLQKNPSEKVTKFIYNQIDGYYLDTKSKYLIYQYFSAKNDFTNVHSQFFQTIKQLLGRNESDYQFSQKVYTFAIRIIKQAYDKWSITYRSKCLSSFKTIFYKYVYMCKSKPMDTRHKILKEHLTSLLQEINFTNIFIFNTLIIDQEMWKWLSNTNFQNLLTQVIEKYSFFDKLFTFLQKTIPSKQEQQQFIKIIKFSSGKLNSMQDSTFKYIQIISKFPQIFEELLESTSYSQLQEQMKKVINLFKANPSTPFHIFTLTFEKINYSQFSNYNKQPGLLTQKKQKNLSKQPKLLKFYDAIFELILQTHDHKLRSELCCYIFSLFFNYKHSKSSSNYGNGQEYFLTFLTEILQNFVSDYKEFINNPSTQNQMYVALELLEKALQFTDILGCGEYRPHKSLVSTSTIFLRVVNNVTFGDDVVTHLHRDFPSSMTLFDALAIIGLSFKCGPEEMVLKQNGKFISPIFNSFSLQDLHLTNDELRAEPNEANYLQVPQIFQEKTKQLRPEIVKTITDVFNRFAFEGKMSILQCTNYVRRASGSQCLSSDRRVKQIFQLDADNDGILVLSDFLEYYRKNLSTSSQYYRQQILKGFYNLRYRKNLTLYNDPLNISQQYYLMARYKISKNYSNIYDILFLLAAHHNEDLSYKSKKLLLFLPSYLQIKKQILKQIDLTQSTEFEIYYKLLFIQSQLNTADQNQSLADSKKKKIDLFVNNKNNQIIFMLLSKYHSQLKKSQYQEKSLLICLRILRSLINIQYLAKANINQTKFDQISIPHLPVNTFFAQQTKIAFNSRNIINFQTLLVLQLTQSEVDILSVIRYCFNQQEQIRKIACNFIFFWSLKTKFQFNLFDITISQERNEQWFDLLCRIIQQSKQINLQTLKNRSFSILLNRQQNFHNSYDHIMNGYLKILLSISKKEKITVNNGQELFGRLLNNSLQPKNRALIFDLIKNIKPQVGYHYFDEMLNRVVPSQQCQIRKRFLGIKNLGAICYINSIIQQFFMIDKFKYMILNRSIPQNCKEAQVNGKIVIDDFLYQLQKLYHYLQYSQKKYIIPKDFCFSYKDFDGKPINTSIQQDAHEFLNRLIENAEQAFKKQNKLQQFADILTIKKLSEIQCEKCGNRIDKIENDYCLTIEVKGHNSVIDSLKKFTEKEEIADYFCEKCDKKVNKINKKTYLNELPQIVILNLQRIIYDQMKGEKVKVHTQLSFPLALNFQDYVKNDSKNFQTQYNLKGVVIHTGTSQGGHYYSLIKTTKYGWLKFNDQSVTQFDEKDIQRECFGGFQAKDGWGDITYSTNAYILFYQRSEQLVQDFIEVQNQFTGQIQAQNKSLINEYQVHQQSFFNAIISYYQSIRYPKLDEIMKNHPFLQEHLDSSLKQQYQKMLKIIKKAFSFLTIYSSITPSTRTKIGHIFCQLIFILPEQTLVFLKEVNMNTYIENVISNSTANQRQILKQVICSIIVIHCRYYGLHLAIKTQQQTNIIQLIKIIHSYNQSLHFYNNIGKVLPYLSLLNILMKNLQCVTQYLLQNDFFFQLLDLIMGKDSFYMKYHHFAQDLHTNSLPVIYDSINYLLQFKINLKGVKLCQASTFPTNTLQGAIITSPTFYRRIIRKKYEHPLLTSLICHYSIGDFDFTAVIAQFLMYYLNNRDQIGDITLFFHFIKSFLVIKDDLRLVRYNWILGIPQNRELVPHQYCLQYSDRTDYLKYISGINHKKHIYEDQKKPVLQIANDKNRIHTTSLYCIQVILFVALQSEQGLQYLLSIPPSNYMYRSYFDWIPSYVELVNKDNDFIIQKKAQTLSHINNQLQVVLSQVKISLLLPVQKNIIGKTKSFQSIQKINQKSYDINLQRITTYVLQNKPAGQQNQSMPRKYFSSQDPKGIGNAFIRNRSKHNFESQVKDIKFIPTLYVLSGTAKEKLLIISKGKLKVHIIVNEGPFNLNFPYEKQGQILNLFQILIYGDYRIEPIPQQINKVFKIQQKKEGMDEEKGNFNPANPSIEFVEPKIKCGTCTYDNDLTSQRCEMCEAVLFM